MKRILITDGVHKILPEELRAHGYEVDYYPKISLEKVIQMVRPYSGLVINSKIRVDARLLDEAPQLEFVARLGSGMEIIDQEEMAKRGVAVFNSPDGNCNAVAEHAMGMILAWNNHLLRANEEVKNFQWNREKNRGIELEGKTIGIIGFGHTGSALARKLQGFSVRIKAYDKYKPSGYAKDYPWVEECSDRESAIRQSEVVSLHLPLNYETLKLANRSFLNQCKPGALLVNTSRGPVVDTIALIEALENKQIRGACLDVLANEKPATYTPEEQEMYRQLYAFPQVLVSPHVAGWTKESKYKLAKILLDKILTHCGSSMSG
ncbi:hydroxyacid dehydrogenase [Membranicola marinus]|uniref:Hydroxyacid dehydrogenase n=1 Tax=Membranihabitans marinus TaxID=1227546 RepID=A0A953L9D6_9BACT|nr:NAD(P)-dependent oxidoreductase [Membranihabitans marinus]MBY5956546.1 hydroxyacid dehydrogenase [Membranihabitans marinus]